MIFDKNGHFIEVDACIQYWEDSYLNGVADLKGDMPLRSGNRWKPIIDIDTGYIMHWPMGVDADIHYKVCDSGEYWLLNPKYQRIAKWNGFYVPDDVLCIDSKSYGDYIIFKISHDGYIINWKKPSLLTNRLHQLMNFLDIQ